MAKKDDTIKVEDLELEDPKKEVPEEPKEETPPQEPEQETPEEEPEQEPPAEEEGEEEAPPQMSKRKAERLAKLENLVSNLRGDEAPKAPTPQGMNYADELTADEETVTRLEADRKQAADFSFNEGLERAKSIQFHTRLEIDAPRVEAKYSHLNPDSEDFNASRAKSLQDWYLATVGFNPQNDTVVNHKLRWGDFVDGIMEISDSMAGAKVETTQKNIVKQAANTGIRPDGSTSKMNLNKNAHEMSDDELKAKMSAISRSLK